MGIGLDNIATRQTKIYAATIVSNVDVSKKGTLLVKCPEVKKGYFDVVYVSPYYTNYESGFIAIPDKNAEILISQIENSKKWYYLGSIVDNKEDEDLPTGTNTSLKSGRVLPTQGNHHEGRDIYSKGLPETLLIKTPRGHNIAMSDEQTDKSDNRKIQIETSVGKRLVMHDGDEVGAIMLENEYLDGMRISSRPTGMGAPNSIEIRSAGPQTLQSATGGISLIVDDGEEINIRNDSTGGGGALSTEKAGNVNISSKYRDINITNENALDPLDPMTITNAENALLAAVSKGRQTILVPHGPILPTDGLTFMDNLVWIFYNPAMNTWDFGVGIPPVLDPVTGEVISGEWITQAPIGEGLTPLVPGTLKGLNHEDQGGWDRFVTYFAIAYKQGRVFINAGQGLQLECTEGNIIIHCPKKISIISDDEINMQAGKDIKIHSLAGNVDITAGINLNFQGLVGANIQGPESGINMTAVKIGIPVVGTPPIPIIPGYEPEQPGAGVDFHPAFIPLDPRIPDVDLVKRNANKDPIQPVQGAPRLDKKSGKMVAGKPSPHITLDLHQHYEPLPLPKPKKPDVGV